MTRLVAGLAVVAVAFVGLVLMLQTHAQPAIPGEAAQDTFAGDRDSGFDADKAFDYLKRICNLGPRVSGTEAMKRQQDMLRKHFEQYGAKVVNQRFTARQRSQRDPVEMNNLIVSWYPERTRRILISTHYDTRPIADQEPIHERWNKGFLGANDGASGVGLMMELGKHIKDLQTAVGIDFVFFDGEEYIFDPGEGRDRYFFGSDYFAGQYARSRGRDRYIGGILLDMVGGKGANFLVERNSWMSAGQLVQQIWGIAEAEKCATFDRHFGVEILDDHLGLNRARIPTIDIIDDHYLKTHWHRLSDRPENCSPETLGEVARVLIAWLKKVK